MKQLQSIGITITSPVGDVTRTLHFIALVMTNYIFTHLGCSLKIPFGNVFNEQNTRSREKQATKFNSSLQRMKLVHFLISSKTLDI